MSFNFGAQPFKYNPESGYIAVCETSKENLKQNDIGSGGASSQSKSVKNAPQAIIIEVTFGIRKREKGFMYFIIVYCCRLKTCYGCTYF
jgi:hypothetical protein